MKLLSLPIVNYMKRYWLLLLVIGILTSLYAASTLALAVRGSLLVPIFVLISGAAGLLYRNIYCQTITDKYVEDKGKLQRDWDSMTGFQRILIMKIEAVCYFLGGCLVAMGLIVVI